MHTRAAEQPLKKNIFLQLLFFEGGKKPQTIWFSGFLRRKELGYWIEVLVHLTKVQIVATEHSLWPTVSSLGEEGTAIRMPHIANWMAAFVLLYGSALQSLESRCRLRWCRVEDPHCPGAMFNSALRSTVLATTLMSIRKEARMQAQSLWTLDSIPVTWKRCRNLLWHKLSPADPSKFPHAPFIGIGLAITSVNTADGCVPFWGISTDQTVVQTETS